MAEKLRSELDAHLARFAGLFQLCLNGSKFFLCLLLRAFQADLDIGFRDTAGAVAELLHHKFGGVGVQRLGDGGHDAHLHQRADQVGGLDAHPLGQLADGNDRCSGRHVLAWLNVLGKHDPGEWRGELRIAEPGLG